MPKPTPLSQAQRNLVRTAARKAWRLCQPDSATAIVMAHAQNRREVGQQFLAEADQLTEDLIEHWLELGVCEPAAVFVSGEPGMQEWDE
jgi:hypothetical protein